MRSFVSWILLSCCVAFSFQTTCYSSYSQSSVILSTFSAGEAFGQEISAVPENTWTSSCAYQWYATPVSGTFHIIPGQTTNNSNAIFSTAFYTDTQHICANGSVALTQGAQYTFLWVVDTEVTTGIVLTNSYVTGSSYQTILFTSIYDLAGQFCFKTISPSPSVSASPSATPTPSRTPTTTPSVSSTPSVTPSVSPQPVVPCSQCSTDSDCSGGRGVCISSSFGRYCSCLSGFGGCDCSQVPASFCNSSYGQVTTLSGNFQANTTVDYIYPMLFVKIDANLQESIFGNGTSIASNSPPYSLETLVFFGPSDTSFPACSYPNGGLTWIDYAAQPGACYDKFLSNMTWSFAKDYCGFAAINSSRNYTQTITIQRKFKIDGSLERTEQTTRSLYVVFPEEVPVSDSNVTVSFPAADAQAALTYIDYNPNTQLWTVQVQTSVPSPYSLGTPSLLFLTGTLTQRPPSVSVSSCATVGSYCVQTITYTYPQGTSSDPCLGLVGLDSHTFSVLCSTSSCPSDSFNLTIQLNTGNACPVTDFIDFSETSLSSFSDASLSTPAATFSINDQAYFGASIQTSEAMISSRNIKSNSVCFKPSSGSCFYANYTLLSPTSGKDPVFVVDFTQPANAAYFSNITSPTQFSVSAVVQVNFVGAKGLLKNVPQTQEVQTISQAVIQPDDSSSSSLLSPWISFGSLVILSLVFL